MPVVTFAQPNFTTDTDPTVYKTKLDAAAAANQQLAGLYAAHESAAPNMTVTIAPGRHMYNGALVVQAQQILGPFTAPTTNPRIDRVVINESTGVATGIAGTEAASPVAPAIPAGYFPCCSVLLDNSPATTAITNALITDERTVIKAELLPGYKYVPLATPELLVNASAIGNTWTTVDSATLAAAGAKVAKLRCYYGINITGTTVTGGLHVRKTGSGLADDLSTIVCAPNGQLNSSGSINATQVGTIDIPLDANQDFDWRSTTIATESTTIYLDGYYV